MSVLALRAVTGAPNARSNTAGVSLERAMPFGNEYGSSRSEQGRPGGQLCRSRDFGRIAQHDASNVTVLQLLDHLPVSRHNVFGRRALRVDTDDVGVGKCRGRPAAGKLVVQSAIGGNEPLRQRSVHQQQEYADEAERNYAVSFLLFYRVQSGSGPCFKGKIIGKCRSP